MTKLSIMRPRPIRFQTSKVDENQHMKGQMITKDTSRETTPRRRSSRSIPDTNLPLVPPPDTPTPRVPQINIWLGRWSVQLRSTPLESVAQTKSMACEGSQMAVLEDHDHRRPPPWLMAMRVGGIQISNLSGTDAGRLDAEAHRLCLSPRQPCVQGHDAGQDFQAARSHSWDRTCVSLVQWKSEGEVRVQRADPDGQESTVVKSDDGEVPIWSTKGVGRDNLVG